MLFTHLRRGLLAGTVGGLSYGLFVATVAVNLVKVAESLEAGHHDGQEPVVSATTTVAVSIGSGLLWGLFLGLVVFGLVYYFVEPAVPGSPTTRSYLLGAAGFVTVSGAPWLVLSPLPPGVEQALPNDTRLLLYAAMMIGGAVTCGAAVFLYGRISDEWGRAFGFIAAGLPFVFLIGVSLLAPANPTSGTLPDGFLAAFRWTVVFGQAALWVVLASVHAWSSSLQADAIAKERNPDAPASDVSN
jgi:hypothetical protein